MKRSLLSYWHLITANGTNSTLDISTESLSNMSATLVNAVQLNVLGGVLNITLLSVDVTESVPEPGGMCSTASDDRLCQFNNT